MFIRHNDAQLFTLSFGNAPRTLLLFGGWAGSWEVWAETIPYLLSGWRCVAYDHRGTGATLCPVESISFDALVDDVFGVMDALSLDQCVLAAESAGAGVAVQAVLRHPERFTGLGLIDGRVRHPRYDQQTPFVRGLTHQFEATIRQFVDACVPDPDTDAIRNWGRQILLRSPQAAAIRLFLAMSEVDLLPQAHQISQPTLIVHSAGDRIVPVDEGRELAGRIPGSRLHILQGNDHVPTVTVPQEVAQAIQQYFG